MHRSNDVLKNQGTRLWVAFALIFLGFVIFRVSWICDDAYITFRSIQNFINGYGLVYNVGERVQSFTHPLWMLLISTLYFVISKVAGLNFPSQLPLIVIVLSWVISLSAALIFAIAHRDKPSATILGLLILASSKAFTDFAAAGLENPLTYLFIAVFYWRFFLMYRDERSIRPIDLFIMSLIVGLSILNRMDTALIFLPALVMLWWSTPNKLKGALAIFAGFFPFILWELFSTVYYGFPFPNTAYAKLNSGISAGAYVHQGFMYFLNSISLDPITLLTIMTAGVALIGLREKRFLPAILGLWLYVFYILRIGGDYMSGRFLSTLVFLSVMTLAYVDLEWKNFALPASILILLFGISTQTAPFLSDSSYEDTFIDNNAIANERGFRYQEWGFLRMSRNRLLPDSPYANDKWTTDGSRDVVESGAIGLQGYMQGPNVHILDVMALTDPLLARLPALDRGHWRIGHIERLVPEGYRETLLTGENRISDPYLKEYYDYLSLITHSPIWDRNRVITIWEFTIGAYSGLMDSYINGQSNN